MLIGKAVLTKGTTITIPSAVLNDAQSFMFWFYYVCFEENSSPFIEIGSSMCKSLLPFQPFITVASVIVSVTGVFHNL